MKESLKVLLYLYVVTISISMQAMIKHMMQSVKSTQLISKLSAGAGQKATYMSKASGQSAHNNMLSNKSYGSVIQVQSTKLQEDEKTAHENLWAYIAHDEQSRLAAQEGCKKRYEQEEQQKIRNEFEPNSYGTDQLKAKMYAFLQHVGMDAYPIRIVIDPTINDFKAMRSVLLVNKNTCGRYVETNSNDTEFEYMLLKELQHMLHDDHFAHYCLQEYAIKNNKHNDQALKALESKLLHAREKRADILAALTDAKYAKEGYRIYYRASGADARSFHECPTYVQRAAYLDEILEQI